MLPYLGHAKLMPCSMDFEDEKASAVFRNRRAVSVLEKKFSLILQIAR